MRADLDPSEPRRLADALRAGCDPRGLRVDPRQMVGDARRMAERPLPMASMSDTHRDQGPDALLLTLGELVHKEISAEALLSRIVDVMEELVKFTLLVRDRKDHLVDRYSERKESAQELMERVNQRAI